MILSVGGCDAGDVAGPDECSRAVNEQYLSQIRYAERAEAATPEEAAELVATSARTFAARGTCGAERQAWLAAERSYALAEAEPERHLAEYDDLLAVALAAPENGSRYSELVRARQARALRITGRADESLALYAGISLAGDAAAFAEVGRALALEATGDSAAAYDAWTEIHAEAAGAVSGDAQLRRARQARRHLDRLDRAARHQADSTAAAAKRRRNVAVGVVGLVAAAALGAMAVRRIAQSSPPPPPPPAPHDGAPRVRLRMHVRK